MSNVTSIDTKQGSAPSAKFTIQATLDGFPIVIEGEGRAGDLRIIVDRLKAIGAEPPRPAAPAQRDRNAQPASDAPKCSVHRSPMKHGRKGWFCPRKDDYGEYCDQTA